MNRIEVEDQGNSGISASCDMKTLGEGNLVTSNLIPSDQKAQVASGTSSQEGMF